MKPKTKLNKIKSELSKVVKKCSLWGGYDWFTNKEWKVLKNETEVLWIRIKHLKDAIGKTK